MKKEINKSLIFLYIVLLFPFLKIHKINEMLGSSIMNLYMILSSVSLFAVFLTSVKKIRLTKTFCFFFFYQFAIILSTILFRGFSLGILLSIFVNILVFILALVHLREILASICLLLTPSIIINFWGVLTASGAPNEMFFLGGKNAIGVVVVSAAFILILNSLHENDRISPKVIAVATLGTFSTIMAGSATGIVVSVVAIFFFLFFLKGTPRKFLWFGLVISAYAMFLLFSEEFFTSEIWASFVEMLGKDATLTSRTRIWLAVTELIKTNLLFGFGRGLEISYSTADHFGATQFETHNIALQVLLDGGLIAMVFFILFLFYVVKHLNMHNIKHRILFTALIVLLVNGLTESIVNSMYTTIIFSVANAYITEENDVDKLSETDKVTSEK